eukprot:gene10600-14240_t
MGNTGSFTSKAVIHPTLYSFTRWNQKHVQDFLTRGLIDLSDTFGLRKNEFEFLLSKDLIDFNIIRDLFQLFDTKKQSIIDKFEVMCALVLISKLTNKMKIYTIFDIFNFNNKGYLLESELFLMFSSLTRGVFKIDHSYIPPTMTVISDLIKFLLTNYAKEDPLKSVRKPELLLFVLENKDISGFIESWRGHSSQVLLGSNEKWRDLTFPANESSIIPATSNLSLSYAKHWSSMGLPSNKYIKWRRKNNIGLEGCNFLFTHELSFLKNVDRLKVYKGNGIIGKGFLKQGMLADRWLMNGISAMISRPETILSCFSETGQEEQGRHCLNFFEHGSWQSVYVDDRIPCGQDCNPLFLRSSNPLEAWPMILEKGFAKYFGSYGHIAACCNRPDATITALRMLTGGHVMKCFTNDFEWRTVEDEIIGESGFKFINGLRLEGSIITFIRSEPMALMDNSNAQKRDVNSLPPHGRMFPLVGNTIKNGYNHLILRDAWDLIDDKNHDYDNLTGHSNTFHIKLEDIPMLYDIMIISRYPDSIRSAAEALRIKSWRTEVLSDITHGINDPAKFLLIIKNKSVNSEGLVDSEATSRAKSANGVRRYNPEVNVQDKIDQADAVRDNNINNNSSQNASQIRLRDSYDFSRKNSKGGISSGGNRKESRRKSRFEKARIQLIEITFTVSSSLNWSIAGSPQMKPRIRVKIVPSVKTLLELIARDRENENEAKKQLLQLNGNISKSPINTNNNVESSIISRVNSPSNYDDQMKKSRGVSFDVADHEKTASNDNNNSNNNSNNNNDFQINPDEAPATAEKSYDQQFTISVSASRCWISHSVRLVPGEYQIFADVSYDGGVTYEQAVKLTSLTDEEEAEINPWDAMKMSFKAPFSSMRRFQNFNKNKLNNNNNNDNGGVIKSSNEINLPGFMNNNNSIKNNNKDDTTASVLTSSEQPHKIWIQMTSTDAFELKPFPNDIINNNYNLLNNNFKNAYSTIQEVDSLLSDMDQNNHAASVTDINKINPHSLSSIVPPPEVSPLLSENQYEVCSRELLYVLHQMREEATVLGIEFVTIANEYKEKRRKQVMHRKVLAK